MIEDEYLEQLQKAERISREVKQAYESVFSAPLGKIVLKHLRDFCRAEKSSFRKDPCETAFLEGRREVYLQIIKYSTIEGE